VADTLIAAVVAKYGTLAFTPKPTLRLGEADTHAAAALPCVVLAVDALDAERLTATAWMETSRVTFAVYAATLAAVDAVVQGIKYDTGGMATKLGFDDGTLPALAGGSLNEMRRTAEPVAVERQRTEAGGWAYTARLSYDVEVIRSE
jgi:hypothetical protein